MAQDIHKPRLGNWIQATVSVAWIKPKKIFSHGFLAPKCCVMCNNETGVQFCMNIFDQVYMNPLHTVGQLCA